MLRFEILNLIVSTESCFSVDLSFSWLPLDRSIDAQQRLNRQDYDGEVFLSWFSRSLGFGKEVVIHAFHCISCRVIYYVPIVIISGFVEKWPRFEANPSGTLLGQNSETLNQLSRLRTIPHCFLSIAISANAYSFASEFIWVHLPWRGDWARLDGVYFYSRLRWLESETIVTFKRLG